MQYVFFVKREWGGNKIRNISSDDEARSKRVGILKQVIRSYLVIVDWS